MTKTIAVCLLVVGMLLFASTGFVANSSAGAPSLQRDGIESAVPTEGPVLLASYGCGSTTCADSSSCCPAYNTCCPAGFSNYCSSTGKCYSTSTDAYAACGWDYYPCAVPAK